MKIVKTPLVLLAAAGIALVTAGPASAAQQFVLVVNKSSLAQNVCVTLDYTDKADASLGCRTVRQAEKTIGNYQSAANLANVRVSANGRTITVPAKSNHCFRVTETNSFHEATDKPCTTS